MINRYLLAAVVLIASCSSPADNSQTSMTDSSEFITSESQLGVDAPDAKQVPHTTEIHDIKLEDPYYWMRLNDEQKEAKEKRTRALLCALAQINTQTHTHTHTQNGGTLRPVQGTGIPLACQGILECRW